MEVEPPQATAAAAAVAAALLKCRGEGGGGEARLEACGKAVSRSPIGEAQEPDGTPWTARRRVEQEEKEEEPLRRGLAAAQARARARRKAGHATPSPSWKLEPSPPRPEEEAASAEADAGAGRRGAPAASARQLGATLWEIQDVIRVASAGHRIRRRGRRLPAEASADADRVRTSPSASLSPYDVNGQRDVCMHHVLLFFSTFLLGPGLLRSILHHTLPLTNILCWVLHYASPLTNILWWISS